MASHKHGTDPINRKEKPNLNPSKRENLEILNDKLQEKEQKLKLDPENKKLQEIVNNLRQSLALERERGYKI